MLSQERRLDLISPELLNLLGSTRKPSTINLHATQFHKWQVYTKKLGLTTLPAKPLVVAAYLAEAAKGDSTASPTLNRCNAISYFSQLAATNNPLAHPLCQNIKEALKRKLGITGRKKTPLLRCQIIQMIHLHLSQHSELSTLMTCLHIALMYEGCLRWNDLAQLQFGDIVITPLFLRLFIQAAKTDAYREGQWITIESSHLQYSASRLLSSVLARLTYIWSNSDMQTKAIMYDRKPSKELVNLPLQDVPVIFFVQKGSETPLFFRKTSYSQFLSKLKAWAISVGLRPQDIGTHSLRRGLASDWALQGIPDRLRREHGRWKSEKVADGYIDDSINIQLKLQALQHLRQR